ncbi:NAD(P)/FAD-dependent oxidoreductase [Roseibacillus persicicus]|uniref:NAD(P)/FAD-dependent oxidoreductase n=1 Tax=Roseibacillus persicicus TaxID=454148 RepID=UPI001E5C33AD|nr:TIGR03862 family flavoprotein [Roseibacillus persicicus]
MEKHLVIVGGGPAGLRAAEVAAAAGIRISLYEAKRSVGRKFLVAGKGGFNITHAEDVSLFATRYRGPEQPPEFWDRALAAFSNTDLRGWAARLDVGTFVASSGRVYPKALKAAPLLRAWLRRLKNRGVSFHVNHRLVGLEKGERFHLQFETPDGCEKVDADAVVLAMGGGSWPQTGSDGTWVGLLESLGIAVNTLTSANCGWEVPWASSVLEEGEGKALKNLVLRAGEVEARGELVITRYGLEGGPIYQLGPALKAMKEPVLEIDFKPTFTEEKLVAKMESARRNFLAEARVRWKLSAEACLILESLYGPFESAEALAKVTKRCQLPLIGPRPIAEAISSAGGVRWCELDEDLMVKKLPGLFVAGEMIDWEAPTGGYLMQGCFASGTLTGQAAESFLNPAADA